MLIISLVLSILCVVLGLGVFLLGVLSLTEKLPGNNWVGLRVPEVRESRRIWQAAHRVASIPWIVSGISLILAAVIILGLSERGFLGLSLSAWAWVPLVALLLTAFTLYGVGGILGSRVAAEMKHRRAQKAESDREAAGCCSSGNCGDSSASNPSQEGSTSPSSVAAFAASSTITVDMDAARRAAESQDQG